MRSGYPAAAIGRAIFAALIIAQEDNHIRRLAPGKFATEQRENH